MNYLASFDSFISGYGIWIIVGCLGLATIVAIIFLILNIKKQKALRIQSPAGKIEIAISDIPVIKEDPKEIKIIEPAIETKETIEVKEKPAVKKVVKKASAEKPSPVKTTTTKPKVVKATTPTEAKTTYSVTYDRSAREWVVKKDGATRASKRCVTKAEALAEAERLSQAKDASLRIHKKDGKFQKQ